MKINKKLMTLYPTKEVMTKQREKYSSLKEMAKCVGVLPSALLAHRKVLKMGKDEPDKRKVNILDIPESVIYNNIKEFVGNQSKNVVAKYQIIDKDLFWQDPSGYAGLEFIGTSNGATWHKISDLMPHAIGGRGQHE